MVDFFGDLGEWRRAADGFLRARMCVRAAPDAAVNDAEASATRTALVILESFVVVVPGAAEGDGPSSSESPTGLGGLESAARPKFSRSRSRVPDHLDARGDRRAASGSAGRSVGEGKMGGGADPLPRRPTAFTSATLQAGDSTSDAEDEAMRSRYLPTMEVAMVTIPDAPLRPMAPDDLIARATEMLASFDGDKVSPDAHAERCLDEWRVREDSDATFIRQCFYGCVRYAKMLGAFTKTMYHARGGDILRSDRDLYVVYAYLLLLRLDELGWDQFERLLGANSEQKMLPLMKFAFDERACWTT